MHEKTSEYEVHTDLTNWWAMCEQNINSLRDQVPFVQTRLSTGQVEGPIVEHWLPATQK